MKTFSHAGISKLNGNFKVRFANDIMRIKVLAKTGHSKIDLVELRHPMTKPDAVKFLLDIDFADGCYEIQDALETAAKKYGVELPNYNELKDSKEFA